MKTGVFFATLFILAMIASTAGATVRVNQFWHAYDPPPSSPPYGYYTYDPVTITSNTTWTAANSPYVLENTVTVAPGVTLTIEAGTSVLVVDNKGIYVNGALQASNVTLTRAPAGYNGSSGTGYWLGIYLSPTSGASNLANSSISYAGEFNSGFGLIYANGAYRKTSLYVDDCNPQITGCIVSNSETNGIELFSSAATIQNNTFTNMGDGYYPMVFDSLDNFPVMGGNATSGTGYNGIALPGGDIAASGSWNLPGSSFPYLMTGHLNVNEGVTLTVAAGNTVKSNWDAIYVNGTLSAVGTSGLPITFSSRAASPAAGNWRGIYLAPTAGSSALSYVTINYSGAYNSGFGLVNVHGANRTTSLYVDSISPPLTNLSILNSETNGLELYGASPTITSSNVQGCAWNGLRAESGSRPAISTSTINGNGSGGYFAVSIDASSVPNPTGVTFSGNTKQGIEVREGTLTVSGTWKNWSANAPYAVTGNVTVDAGVNLTIAPTTTVKLWGQGIYVNGTLTANSTSGRITFTSLADDTIGGDTNGDSNASTPAGGNWKGIYLSPASGSSILNNCTISYSGQYNSGFGLINANGAYRKTSLYVDDCNPQITGCIVSNSETNGIELFSSAATIQNNTFTNMGDGYYPMVFDSLDTFPVMGGNATSGTGYNGIALPGGDIAASGSWNLPGSSFPYLMTGHLNVNEGVTLTVAAGNTVKSNWDAIYVNGTLSAVGTSGLPITFSSRAASPAAGNWRGIYLAPTAGASALSHVTINYSGAYNSGFGLVNVHGANRTTSLYVDSISPPLTNLSILNSQSNGLELYGASPTISNAQFANCGYSGLRAENGSRPAINTATINGNGSGGYFAVSIDATSVPNPTGVTFSGNIKQGIEVRGGTLPLSGTWKNWSSNAPYAVTGHVTVAAGVNLTIEPTTTVKLWYTYFYVYGTLTANSTTGRITFTSLADDSIGGDTNGNGSPDPTDLTAGNWLGIYISPDSGSSVFNNCTISYSGYYNSGYGLVNAHGAYRKTSLYVDDCNPQITGCTISNSETNGIELFSSAATIQNNTFTNMGDGYYPMVFDSLDTFPVMGGNATSGTGYNGIALPGGDIAVSGSWNLPGSSFPYLMTGHLNVNEGVTLTVAAGNTVKSNWNAIYVNGTLSAVGTAGLPITFGSRAASPAAGNWLGIYLAPTAGASALSYVTINYSGAYNSGFGLVNAHGAYRKTAFYVDSISPPLTNLSIMNSQSNGLELYGASPTITNSRFESCGGTQIAATAASHPTVSGTRFIGTSSVWGFTTDTLSPVINARNNYWGAASGPYDPSNDTSGYNPSGAGVHVSDGIDYSSYLTSYNIYFTIAFAGTGGGTVTSSPGDATCTTTTTYTRPEGTSYTLYGSGNADSVFTGWSDACSGTDPCDVALNADTLVTATFDYVKPARILSPLQSFDTIAEAYLAVGTGAVIQLRDYVFTEPSVNFNRSVNITVIGGYDKTFTNHSGVAVINGLIIGLGSATVENLSIK